MTMLYSTPTGIAWHFLTCFFRFAMAGLIGPHIWANTDGGFKCDTQLFGCEVACYNSFMPIGMDKFWQVQILCGMQRSIYQLLPFFDKFDKQFVFLSMIMWRNILADFPIKHRLIMNEEIHIPTNVSKVHGPQTLNPKLDYKLEDETTLKVSVTLLSDLFYIITWLSQITYPDLMQLNVFTEH